MVLSNKKLKQKLRAAIAESLTSAVEPDPNDSSKTNPYPNSQPQSLKQLLNSVGQKPRLSKRERKRRTQDSLQDSETVDGNGENDDKKKKFEEESDNVVGENKANDNKKKRKRNGENSDESKNPDVGGGVGENVEKKKKRKKKERSKKEEGDEESGDVKKVNKLKKKKKKQKNKKRANKNQPENKSDGELVVNEEPHKGSDSQANGDVATKVYVGGIPYNASENDIKTYFEGCGTITEIDYMTFPDSGKFRGIAIISFRTEGAAKRALALDGAEMDGLFLKIQPYKTTKVIKTTDFAPKIVEGYNRVYVGNLSWDITEEDLKKLFSDCKISSIRFGADKETGEFHGYAHVDFFNSLSLSLALKLDQEIVCGRPVKISCAVPPKKAINTKSSSLLTENAMSSNVTDIAGSTENAGSGAVSGKIRRRTCYECGEKGHLSSACPKKTADRTNSNGI